MLAVSLYSRKTRGCKRYAYYFYWIQIPFPFVLWSWYSTYLHQCLPWRNRQSLSMLSFQWQWLHSVVSHLAYTLTNHLWTLPCQIKHVHVYWLEANCCQWWYTQVKSLILGLCLHHGAEIKWPRKGNHHAVTQVLDDLYKWGQCIANC